MVFFPDYKIYIAVLQEVWEEQKNTIKKLLVVLALWQDPCQK